MEENNTEQKQDVNEMLAEQQRELERLRGGKHKKMDTEKVRKCLNISFIIIAAIGLLKYFGLILGQDIQTDHHTGLIIIGVALVVKCVEFFVRFML